MKYITSLVFFLIILTGCASINTADLPQESERINFDPLEVAMAYDVYGIRLDLFRQIRRKTEQVQNAECEWETKTETVKIPYHYLGVHLGNGLFFDAHKNLSIDLVRLLRLDEKEKFTIIKKPRNLFDITVTYAKDNNRITMQESGLFGMKKEVMLNEFGALIKGGFLEKDQDINITPDWIEYDPHGIFRDWHKTKIIKTTNGAKIPGFWSDTEIVREEDGNITLGNNLKIEHMGSTIEVILSGFFGPRETYTLMQSENRIAFINEYKQGVIIDISENKVVLSNKWESVEFEIK